MSRSRQKRAERWARTARVRAVVHPSFTGVIFDVWRRAREVWMQFFDRHIITLVRLATREVVLRAEHRKMSDWICHLEMLVRCLIVTAALGIKVTLRALARVHTRRRRIVIVRDDRPSTWVRLSLSIFPSRSPRHASGHARSAPQSRFARTLPLARRLETLRRILVEPEPCARRAAFHLARLAAANATSNQPRRITLTPHAPRSRAVSRGWQAIESGLEKLMPVCEDRAEAWNRAPEPG